MGEGLPVNLQANIQANIQAELHISMANHLLVGAGLPVTVVDPSR